MSGGGGAGGGAVETVLQPHAAVYVESRVTRDLGIVKVDRDGYKYDLHEGIALSRGSTQEHFGFSLGAVAEDEGAPLIALTISAVELVSLRP